MNNDNQYPFSNPNNNNRSPRNQNSIPRIGLNNNFRPNPRNMFSQNNQQNQNNNYGQIRTNLNQYANNVNNYQTNNNQFYPNNQNFPRISNPYQNNQNNRLQNRPKMTDLNNNVENPFMNQSNSLGINCRLEGCIHPAENFCESCYNFFCYNCIVYYHSGHKVSEMKETLGSLENSLKSFKDRYYDFKKNKSKFKDKDEYVNKLNQASENRISTLNGFKAMIDKIITSERELNKLIIDFYNNEYYNEIDGSKQMIELSILQARKMIEYCDKDWINKSDTEKLKELINNAEIRTLRKDADKLFDTYSKDFSKINGLSDKIVARMEELNKNFQIKEDVLSIELAMKKLLEKMDTFKMQDFKMLYENEQNVGINQFNQNNPPVIQNSSNYKKEEHFKYDLFFFINLQYLSEIIIADLNESSTKNYSISNNNELKEFNALLKFVNLGKSVLITGGVDNKNFPSNKCYLVSLSSSKQVLIKDFPSLISKMSSHNIIFLEDRNLVLVCGGDTTSYTQMINPFEPIEWNQTSLMNINRINSTLAYVNQKYIYCFGGDNVKKEYNSYEYLDLDNYLSQWILKTLPNKVHLNTIYSGLISLSTNKFLLCGGLIDNTYITNIIYEIEVKNNLDVDIKIVQDKLPNKGSLFLHNSFLNFLNMSNENKIISYSMPENKFYELY